MQNDQLGLHAEPERDQFKSESPIRAFTHWTVQGLYALGKGFRPSLAHMVPYMDAMESKEGWRLVQILEAASQTPSFVFRKVRNISHSIMVGGLDPSVRERFEELLAKAPAFSPIQPLVMPEVLEHDMQKVGIGLHQIARDIAAGQWPKSCKFQLDTFVDRINGYAAELGVDRHMAGFVEAGEKIAEAEELDRERNPVDDEPISLMEKREPTFKHSDTTDVLASMIGADQAAIARNHAYESRMEERHIEPMNRDERALAHDGVMELVQHGTGRVIKTVPFDAPTEEIVITALKGERDAINQLLSGADDPVNPKHYNGTACAEIGERLSANGYQVLKYCWRLDKKDEPCQELGKGIWYAERELKLVAILVSHHSSLTCYPDFTGIKDETQFLEDRIEDCSTFTQNIARMLWSGYGVQRLQAIIEAINEERFHRECGTGAA